jgi:crotonobetainyl-CoA:carnitine CoA-transferase CaiB-like acyl-CoA transferase
MSETQPTIQRSAPTVGEHTKEVLAEFGFSEQEISSVIAAGVLG